MATKLYSKEEVARHDGGKTLAALKAKLATATGEEKAKLNKEIESAASDVWIIIHGLVYNVTSYLNDHPGGPEQIAQVAGQDATEQFEDIYHSALARQTLKSLRIGKLEGFDGPEDLLDRAVDQGKTNVLVTLVPALVAVGAALYYYFSQ